MRILRMTTDFIQNILQTNIPKHEFILVS